MDLRFAPHVTESRFKKLAYGTPKNPGLIPTWVGLDIRDDIDGQYEMARQVRVAMGVDVLEQVIHTTLGPLFSGEILEEAVEFVCWRIAANRDLLLSDRPLASWKGLSYSTFAPLQVTGTRFGWSEGKKKRPGSVLQFRVIDGELCPIKFERWFPKKFLFVLAGDMGIGSWRAQQPYDGHAPQLYGMRFVGYLSPSKFKDGTITVERSLVGQFKSYNQSLMRRRAKECPLEYKWSCHACTIGEDLCPDKHPVSRACRPVSLKSINCTLCGENTWHSGGDCQKCYRRCPVSRDTSGATADEQTPVSEETS